MLCFLVLLVVLILSLCLLFCISIQEILGWDILKSHVDTAIWLIVNSLQAFWMVIVLFLYSQTSEVRKQIVCHGLFCLFIFALVSSQLAVVSFFIVTSCFCLAVSDLKLVLTGFPFISCLITKGSFQLVYLLILQEMSWCVLFPSSIFWRNEEDSNSCL